MRLNRIYRACLGLFLLASATLCVAEGAAVNTTPPAVRKTLTPIPNIKNGNGINGATSAMPVTNPNSNPAASKPITANPSSSNINSGAVNQGLSAKLITVNVSIIGKGRVRVNTSTGREICASQGGGVHSCDAALSVIEGSPITVVAVADNDSEFEHWMQWSPNVSGGASNCEVTNRDVCHVAKVKGNSYAMILLQANFKPKPKPTVAPINLNIEIPQLGGEVKSATFSQGGIACENKTGNTNGICKAALPYNTTIDVTASPYPGFIFDRWVSNKPNVCAASQPQCIFQNTETVTLSANFKAVPMVLTLYNLPAGVVVGGAPIKINGVVKDSAGKPVESLPMTIALGNNNCKLTSAANGHVACDIDITQADEGTKGFNLIASTEVKGAQIKVDGNPKLPLLNKKGYVSIKLPATAVAGAVNGSIPGGALLNNYANGGDSAASARISNGSWIFTSQDMEESKATPFDLPVQKSAPYYYYVASILVKTGKATLKAPANITVPLSISGYKGYGPTVKGRCFPDSDKFFESKKEQAQCFVGDDSAAPDITNVAINGGLLELQLVVNEAGYVEPKFVSMNGAIDFNCNGVAGLVCGDIKALVNSQLKLNMPSAFNNKMLRDRVRNAFMPFLKEGSMIGTLKEIEIDGAGNIILSGTPAVK